MPEQFHFSPRPNRAHEIGWRPWGADAFEEAARRDRPILLNLTAFWCHWCHLMDETTYSEPELIELLNREVVAIRVDADRYPHVQDRYIAGGWPTNAFLTPSGEVLWAGTYVEAIEFRRVAEGVLEAWRSRRAELGTEIERRRKAMEAARSRRPTLGLVRRESADDVLTAVQDAFDPRNGGFGEAPKFPHTEAVELCFIQHARAGSDEWLVRAERTLDGMLAGELWDAVDGGFFRYATAADWTAPRREKMLEVNAGMLLAYGSGAHLLDRADWRRTAEAIVQWADAVLARPDGLWSGSQDADEEYYGLEPEARRGRAPPATDPILYAHFNAQWIRALAETGGRLGRQDWVGRAAQALERLLELLGTAEGGVHHFHDGSEVGIPDLLVDLVSVSRAAVALAQATGDPAQLELACRIADHMEARLWDEGGGFRDHRRRGGEPGALQYPSRPFEVNGAAARLFLDLALATGERGYRAVAERTLAVLSPLAGRYGASGAEFALAVEEFFAAPLRLVIVGDRGAAAALRNAALALPRAERRVISMESGGRLADRTFAAQDRPVAYVCGPRSCSPPVTDEAGLAAAVAALR